MTLEILWYMASIYLPDARRADLSQNWPQAKKIWILVILSLASFAGSASALANQLGLFPQAKVYHKTPVEASYTV